MLLWVRKAASGIEEPAADVDVKEVEIEKYEYGWRWTTIQVRLSGGLFVIVLSDRSGNFTGPGLATLKR